ncbi:MAG: hypothetical protein ACI3X3_07275 [Acidaminococcus sp.]|uniref:hypothetical protein n=1 Tax=Acidaminococcus sp. TaxID=1872103 RepID=UPI003F166E71
MYKYSPLEVAYQKQFGSDRALREYLDNCAPIRPYGYSFSTAAPSPKGKFDLHLSKEKQAELDAALEKIQRDFGRRK